LIYWGLQLFYVAVFNKHQFLIVSAQQPGRAGEAGKMGKAGLI
jgi:hypothetical protein